MKYTKDNIYKIFKNSILGKPEINILGAVSNTSYNYHNLKNNELIVINEHLPVMQLKNEEAFKNVLYDYVNVYLMSNRTFTSPEKYDDVYACEENKILYALTTLFGNAGFEDFENPATFIKRRLDFIKNNLIYTYNYWMYACDFPNVKNAKLLFKMTENPHYLETPDRLDIKIQRINEQDEIEEFHLPSITFGISNNTAYVYTIQKLSKPSNDNEKLAKEVNRARYKINNNVDEFLDVEPFSIISATVLSGFLNSLNVEKVQVNNYLPIRYYAKERAHEKKAKGNLEVLQELQELQQQIQINLTDKFTKTFLRVENQTDTIEQFSDFEAGFTVFKTKNPQENENTSPVLTQIYNGAKQATFNKSLGLDY